LPGCGACAAFRDQSWMAGTRPTGHCGPVHESPLEADARTPTDHTVLQTGSGGPPIGILGTGGQKKAHRERRGLDCSHFGNILLA
jgi:hypothetical protein